MQGKEILRLVSTLHRNKEIEEELIFQAIEAALESAARKHFGPDVDVSIIIDRQTGNVSATYDQKVIEPETLGRIAAQTAKQVFIQKTREAESDTLWKEYSERIGTLVTGTVQRFEGGSMIVNLERSEGLCPRSEQIPGEHYQPGERIRAIIVDVRKVNSLVRILLSRASPDFIRRLFELEVPEVAEGVVQIRKIAREPGLRTKVAVISTDPRVDCIGACVGVRGTRIKSIIDEVKGEKIDIIPWSDAPETMIADSLRPAEILQITLEEGEHTRRATVVVPEDHLSLAIGWKGQNVRLAVKMTGWDIDIEPPERPAGEQQESEAAEESPAPPEYRASEEALAEAEEDADPNPTAEETPAQPETGAAQDATGTGTEPGPPPSDDAQHTMEAPDPTDS
ncbi:MAG: transcription termination factor NusA [Candidatus Brocadiaceae bacterium]|nr:transcription termination factor NusA [Candidatus Brocadiaceae bacterium]